MAEAAPSADPAAASPELPRWSLTGVALLHAIVFAAAARVLPWGGLTAFAVLSGLLAAGHAAVAFFAATRSQNLGPVWRGVSIGGLGYLAWVLLGVARTAGYLSALYGSVGQGLAVALLVCLTPVLLFTVPISAWGLALTRHRGRERVLAAGTASGLLLLIGGYGGAHWTGAATPLPGPIDEAALEAALPPAPTGKGGGKRSLFTLAPATCRSAPGAFEGLTALIVFRPREAARPELRCVQAPADELPAALNRQLRNELPGGPVKIDIITATHPLGAAHPLIDALRLRPGLDGICHEGHCTLPWQLVAEDAFTTFTPLPFIEDLRFGADPAPLRKRLGAPAGRSLEGLVRIETASYVLTADGLRHLSRLRPFEDRPLDEPHVTAAVRAAERHIVGAQLDNGKFRYQLDPFTAKKNRREWNLPRQAGTTLALCELGRPGGGTQRAIERSLKFMAGRERKVGDGRRSAMRKFPVKRGKPAQSGLGDTALPLIAFTACRPWVGDRHDALIARTSQLLMDMQRPDGSFFPAYDLQAAAPVDGPDRLFAAGQAVFALSMAERLAIEHPDAGFPPAAELREATERAMTYFAGAYWDHWARPFFFAEENWHCLAARASIPHHRHDGYEQFCLDYVRFKSRLLLDDGKGHHPDLVDGYGFGNLLPPHNTTTAGLGESLAAAIAVRRARKEDDAFETAQLRRTMSFLLRQQWREEDCWACDEKHHAVGAWSESMASPKIRIDYVQHAMAAVGHGGQALGLLGPTGAGAR